MTKSVAFQGEPGAYSQQALFLFWGRSRASLPCRDFIDVYRAVKSKCCQFGIIPVENSLAGSIHQNYDLLREQPVQIVGEVKLRVSHHLLACPGAKISDLRQVYSHPQALSQCATFFRRHRRILPTAYIDTAAAARYVSELGRKDIAAIASSEAGCQYGLKSLARGIESQQQNFTRFLAIAARSYRGRGSKGRGGLQKTSLVFAFKNIPGALFKCLSIFAIRDIDLFKIESRPLVGSPWQYLFYCDIQGHGNDPAVKAALAHLREITTYLKVLGSYAAAEEPA